MRQLLPFAADVDPAEAYGADRRERPDRRPWVLANMVTSVDGAAAVAGRTGQLGGAADKAVFSAIRGVADVIVAAAGTVRAERYHPPRPPSDTVARGRAERGQAPRPRLVVVTRQMDLDPDLPLFAEPDQRPLVVTCATADPDRRARIEPVADVIELGQESVDLAAMVTWLGEHGARVVLTEGGPTLLGQLVAEGLVDELCLTIAPLLVAGPERRIAHSIEHPAATDLVLDRVLEADGELLLRYRRA